MNVQRKITSWPKLSLKVVTSLTIGSFLATQVLLPTPVSFAQSPDSKVAGGDPVTVSTAQVRNGKIVIPPELGKVEESFRGTTDKTVIFIQDAHDSLEAQENIAKLIDKFVKEKGIKTVFEEGYEGPVPTDKFFGFIKDPKVKQKVSYFLLDKLRVGGAEYAHINRAHDFKLIGVEDLKLYGQNLQCYQESSRSQTSIAENLDELFSRVNTLANQYFPEELKACLKWKELFSEGKLPLLNYLEELQDLYLKRFLHRFVKSFVKEYPALTILLAAEKKQDPKLIQQLNSLDSKVVFSETAQLEKDISDAFLQNRRDREIFSYYQGLALLKKLNRIELTQTAYEAAKETLLALDTQKLVDFIVSLTHRSLVLAKDWERHIKDAVRFYDVAQKRDGTIDQHVKLFRESKEDVAILVFGGFHGSAIKDMLRQQGFSYVVISPKITAIDKRHQDYYKHLMSEGYHAFEVPFLAARANKPPSVLYAATLVGDLPIENELHALAASVEGPFDPQLIERRLADFSHAQEVQTISTAVVKSKPRSDPPAKHGSLPISRAEIRSDQERQDLLYEVRANAFGSAGWIKAATDLVEWYLDAETEKVLLDHLPPQEKDIYEKHKVWVFHSPGDPQLGFKQEDLEVIRQVLGEVPPSHLQADSVRIIQKVLPIRSNFEKDGEPAPAGGDSKPEIRKSLRDWLSRRLGPKIIAGSYEKEKRIVRIAMIQNPKEFRRLLFHEIGHGVFHFYLSEAQRAAFIRLFRTTWVELYHAVTTSDEEGERVLARHFSSAYGATKYGEDFAEIYMEIRVSSISFTEKSDLFGKKLELVSLEKRWEVPEIYEVAASGERAIILEISKEINSFAKGNVAIVMAAFKKLLDGEGFRRITDASARMIVLEILSEVVKKIPGYTQESIWLSLDKLLGSTGFNWIADSSEREAILKILRLLIPEWLGRAKENIPSLHDSLTWIGKGASAKDFSDILASFSKEIEMAEEEQAKIKAGKKAFIKISLLASQMQARKERGEQTPGPGTWDSELEKGEGDLWMTKPEDEKRSEMRGSTPIGRQSEITNQHIQQMKGYFKEITAPTEIIERIMRALEALPSDQFSSNEFNEFYKNADHGFEHSLQVTKKALEWASQFRFEVDLEALAVGAFLHDIKGLSATGHEERKKHHEAGAVVAEHILKNMGWSAGRIEKVKEIIREHRGVSAAYKIDNYPIGYTRIEQGMPRPNSLEAKLVRDADTYLELENLERLKDITLDIRKQKNPFTYYFDILTKKIRRPLFVQGIRIVQHGLYGIFRRLYLKYERFFDRHRTWRFMELCSFTDRFYDGDFYYEKGQEVNKRLEVVLKHEKRRWAVHTDVLEFLLGKLLENCDPDYYLLPQVQELVRSEAPRFFREFLDLTVSELEKQKLNPEPILKTVESVIQALGREKVLGDQKRWNDLNQLHQDSFNIVRSEMWKEKRKHLAVAKDMLKHSYNENDLPRIYKLGQKLIRYVNARQVYDVGTNSYRDLQKDQDLLAEGPFDAMMVFGSGYLDVPKEAARIAAKLREQNPKLKVIIVGNHGTAEQMALASDVPEAKEFQAKMKEEGMTVPDEYLGTESTNTKGNVVEARTVAEKLGLHPERIVIVSALHRRAGPTFTLHYPGHYFKVGMFNITQPVILSAILKIQGVLNELFRKLYSLLKWCWLGDRNFQWLRSYYPKENEKLSELSVKKVATWSPTIDLHEWDLNEALAAIKDAVNEVGKITEYSQKDRPWITPTSVPSDITKSVSELHALLNMARSEMRATEVNDRSFNQLKEARRLVSEKKFAEAVKVVKPLVDQLNGLISQNNYTQTNPYVLANAYAAPLLLKVAQDPDKYFNAAKLRKSIQILIFDSKGRVLLQKRGPLKRLFPSKYTVSANAKPSKGDDAAAIKEKVKVAIGEEVGINPDLSKISQVGDPDSYHHYMKSYTFEAYNEDEAQRLEHIFLMHVAQSGIAVDYDAVKHALVVYVLKKDEQLSAELDQLVFNIASETGIPNSPAVENLEESSLFTYVLSPDEERRVKEELIPGKVRYKQQALENTAPLTKDALRAIDSDDVEFRDWADVIVAFRERRTDFAEDLVAIHFSDDEIVQKVFASIRNEYFLNLDDTRASSPIISGGKGASLHHLRKMILQDADVKVPEGFVLPADVFFRFVMGNATLRRQIEQLDKLFEVIKTTPKDKRADITVQIETLSRALREGIRNIELPQDLMREISEVLERVRGPVAVRSSASMEDSASAACAGKAESFLNQGSPRQVADSIKKVWGSLFNDGFVSYRMNNDMTGVPLMPVVILKMVNARSAGTLFSVDTNTGRPVFRIEANFGLGESVVSSKVTPDRWLVAPDASMILETTISTKTIMTVPSENGTREVAIEPEMQNQASMRDEKVLELARIAFKIQKRYIASGIANIDTEFAVDQDGTIYIVQTRPETTVKKDSLKVSVTMVDEEKLPLGVQKIELTKSGSIVAVNGVATGRLVVELPPVGIQDEDLQKEFIDKIIDRLQSGDILATVDTDNKWDNAFKRISGVITDQGGHTSHTAVTSRENGIPCLVATRNATDQLKSHSGEIVTFDSYRKAIYLTDHAPVKTVEIDMAIWNPADELLKKPTNPRDFWLTGEEYVEFYRDKENFMGDLEGFWRGRPKTPFGYLELDYYAKAFDRYAQNLNRLFPFVHGAFKGVPWKFKNGIVFTSLMTEADGLQNPLFKLTLNDFSRILGERVREFVAAEEFFAHLDRLDATNVRQTMDFFVELLSWMHIARPFHHVFRTKFSIPQERLMTENALSSDRRPLMELVGLSRTPDEDRHWLIKLTHWDKVKELAAIEELIRADEGARRALSDSPETFFKVRPELYKIIVAYAHKWKTSHEDMRKGVEVDAFLDFVRGNVRADPGKIKTITVQPLLRMLEKWDLKQKGVLDTIRAADSELYLAIRLYGRMKQSNASQGPIGDVDALASLAMKSLVEEKLSEQGLTEAIDIIFDQYPTLGRIFSIGSQEFSFMEDAHQYITRFQKQLYHLLLDVAKQHPAIFGERPEQVFDLSTDEIIALVVDKNPAYLMETFKRHEYEEITDAELEKEWNVMPAKALENYRKATRPIMKGLEDQIIRAGYDGVKAHYTEEIKRITDRIERLQTLARGQTKEPSNATSRSEIRLAAGKVISAQADQIVRSIRKNAQPATVFVDAEDFLSLSEAQKQEYLVVALSNKVLHVVVYNQHGEARDKLLAALFKINRVTRTGEDLDGSQRSFSRANVPSIQLSKQILPSQEVVQRLRKRVSFFKTQGQNGGTLAAALLWAWSGGEDARFREISQGRDGFWTVAETLVNALQRSYDTTLAFAVAA